MSIGKESPAQGNPGQDDGTGNSGPGTGGNPKESVRRGDPAFDEMIEDVEGVVAEFLDNVAEISWPAGECPSFRLKGESKWKVLGEAPSFLNKPDGEASGEEPPEGDACGCYQDCPCQGDPCGCKACSCDDGCTCCCDCEE